MKIYYIPEKFGEKKPSEKWQLESLLIPLKTNKDGSVEPDTKAIMISYYHDYWNGIYNVEYDDELRIYPYKITDDECFRLFIQACFWGEIKR
jgi:hypothetical protein